MLKQPKLNLSVLSILDFQNSPDKRGVKYVPKKGEKSSNRKSWKQSSCDECYFFSISGQISGPNL